MTAAHDRDVELVERFEADRKTYRSTSYKEEWIRQDFTDPLLESLGWDVTNKMSVLVGPQREVIPEEAIRVGGATKASDYGFYLGGSRKFFVEAKKPSVNLEEFARPRGQ
jgi:predicted type IV restriction endonuclease